jgi:hypothetical protein
MKILEQRIVWWNFTIDLAQFPALLQTFVQKEPRTRDIEIQGARLAAEGFSDPQLRKFIQAVCEWGGYTGIAARVIQNNRDLATQFQQAHQAASSGKAVEGLTILRQVKGLGISFASKHLKFLAPDDAVVLDSTIKEQLGYATNLTGYGAFLTDCHDVLNACNQFKIHYTGWGAQGWRVSDIETAIFQKIRQPAQDTP